MRVPTSSLREGDVTNLARPCQHQQHATHWVLLQSGSQNIGFKESILLLHLVTFSFDPSSGTKWIFSDSLRETKDISCVCLASLLCLVIATEIACALIHRASVWLCPLQANLIVFYCSPILEGEE